MKGIRPFRQIGLKIWSVFLAVVLWLAVSGDESVERGLRVPLELQQFPAGLELQGDAPALVDVRVRGESSALGHVGAGDIVAVLDLKTARPGRRLFQLTPEQVRAPFGVEVVQVTPSSVALAFENSATRQLPVIPAIEGMPAAGFVVGKPVSNPATVEVIGPVGAVTHATEALTEPISVEGARQNITETVNVGFQDPALRLKTPRQATVTVPILPGPVERTLQDQPVRLHNLDANLVARAVPSGISIILRGSKDGLARIKPDSITAFVDLGGLGAGDYSLGVQVDANRDGGIARIIPATVQVTISRVKP
jgi:YbbR domain-containing protein